MSTRGLCHTLGVLSDSRVPSGTGGAHEARWTSNGERARPSMAERRAPNVAKTISCVADQLFSEVSRVYKESGTLSDDLLSALNLIFQSPLLPALDLVDRKSVTLLESPSGRKMYRVIGSKDTPYICFSSSNYCSCPSYKFSVLLKDEHLMCKHVLAVKLSEAMDTFKRQQISDKDISSVISRVE